MHKVANRQTNKQTSKQRRLHNLLGGGNDVAYVADTLKLNDGSLAGLPRIHPLLGVLDHISEKNSLRSSEIFRLKVWFHVKIKLF